jgi:hypothetical protein
MIHLVQLLCPARHCIIAAPYDDATTSRQEIEACLRKVMRNNHLNEWCGICGSRDLTFEDLPTSFASLEQALPTLKACEADQLLTKAILDASGASHDSIRKT